jgi:hypothetical protein
MKKTFFTALLTFFISLTYAQQSTHFGVEFGVSKDIYRLFENSSKEPNENGMQLRSVRPPSAIFGFNVRQDLNTTFYVETGLLSKTYERALAFEFEQGHTSSTAFKSLMIPVRIGAKVNLYKEKIQLTPNIGYSFVKNFLPPFGGGRGEGHGTYNYPSTISTKYSYSSQHHAKSHALFQTGIGIDIKMSRSITLSLSGKHYEGSKKIISQDIKYSVNNQPEQTAHSYSTGDMRTYNIGFRCSLGNILKK